MHRSCGQYSGTLKDVILLYKYRSFRILGKELSRFMLQALGDEDALWWRADAVIPVPLHPKRKKYRGFNQSQVLAEEIAKLKGIPLMKSCLIKKKNVPPQTSFEARNREKNIKNAFGVHRPDKIKGKVIILVDDVFTTGSTVQECSTVLMKAGVKEVRAVTLAQAGK